MTLDSPVKWAVVDVETTGLGRDARVIEFACEVLDDRGRLMTRYATLVDPGRHPGPSRLHGIQPTMLGGAPPFASVAASIGRLLHGRVVVVRHLPFDWSVLRAEFARLGVACQRRSGVGPADRLARPFASQCGGRRRQPTCHTRLMY